MCTLAAYAEGGKGRKATEAAIRCLFCSHLIRETMVRNGSEAWSRGRSRNVFPLLPVAQIFRKRRPRDGVLCYNSCRWVIMPSTDL